MPPEARHEARMENIDRGDAMKSRVWKGGACASEKSEAKEYGSFVFLQEKGRGRDELTDKHGPGDLCSFWGVKGGTPILDSITGPARHV